MTREHVKLIVAEAKIASLETEIAELRKDRERLTELDKRYRWRTIAEFHEDYGPCVVINIEDPGHLEIEWVTSLDYDESLWTHFSQIAPLSNEEAELMIAAMAEGKGAE